LREKGEEGEIDTGKDLQILKKMKELEKMKKAAKTTRVTRGDK